MLPKLQPGDKIAGSPYVVVDAIGKGGMGSVYKVRDTLLEIERAIKFIDVEVERGAKRDQAIAEVLKEGRVIAKLHHACPEHIVEVLSMGITADQRATPYLVMELVPGVTLSDFLKRRGGRLEAKYARQLAVEVLAALVVAHDKGIVHRDLKPANIMVQPIPGSETAARMKLIDFGITSEVGRRTIRRALTFRYGAPEQVHIEGQHVITAQTDLYALGVILFEAIAGRGPFDDICTTPEQFILAHLKHPAPSIATVVPWIPREHAQLIDSMLEKDPRKRPDSARALGSKFSDLPWDFATSIPEDSQKTEENMNTALASVVQAVEDQKRARALHEQKSKAPPQAAPPSGQSARRFDDVAIARRRSGRSPDSRSRSTRSTDRPNGAFTAVELDAWRSKRAHGDHAASAARGGELADVEPARCSTSVSRQQHGAAAARARHSWKRTVDIPRCGHSSASRLAGAITVGPHPCDDRNRERLRARSRGSRSSRFTKISFATSSDTERERRTDLDQHCSCNRVGGEHESVAADFAHRNGSFVGECAAVRSYSATGFDSRSRR